MKYPEFAHIKEEFDIKNPFCRKFVYEDGATFYIEPVFYTQLQGFKTYRGEEYQRIIDEIERLVKKNRKVVFTGNYEHPQTDIEDGFIFLEITDVTDPLKIFVEDKSRGSDYGD